MKINEITQQNYKVTQSSPQGIEIASPDGTKINLPPEKLGAIHQDPSNPNMATLDLTNANAGQPMQQAGKETMGQQPANGQQPAQTPPDGQVATGQPPIQGQQPAQPGQQPANGQAPQPGQPQQPQLPKVGSEIELDDNVGSTMQEMLDDKDDEDLMASRKNKDISGDPTDKFINDVVDKKFEKNAGRSQRNVVQPDPIRESEELIAMLTIAGLR